jgi:predicted porin
MKKTLLALAVAGIVAAPAAMAEVTVYGLAHISLDNVSTDADGGDQDLAVTSRASRVGVKAAEDLGGGLTAVAQMEWQIDMSDDNTSTGISSRNQIVGLAGGFGTVALGRHDTPYKMSTGKLDLFSDTAADYNLLIGSPAGLENRGNDVVAYLSPDFNGFSFQAAIVAADVVDDEGDDANVADATSIAVQYNAGPLFVALANESFEDEVAAGAGSNKGQSGTRLGVGYDFGMAKVGFVYETASDVGAADDDYNAWLINAAFPVGGNNTIIAEYGVGTLEVDASGVDDTERTLYAVGVSHGFSKTSSAYVAYGNLDVDADGSASDDTAGIITAGMVVKF